MSLEQTLMQHTGQGQESVFSRLGWGVLWRIWVRPGQVGKNQVRCSPLLDTIHPQLSHCSCVYLD